MYLIIGGVLVLWGLLVYVIWVQFVVFIGFGGLCVVVMFIGVPLLEGV